MRILLLLASLLLAGPGLRAQSPQIQRRELPAGRAETPLRIDGRLDEADWARATESSDFWAKWPVDTKPANRRTTVKTLYDDTFLYFGIVCEDSSDYIIQTLKRDQEPWGSDGVAIILDPVDRRTNGFFFYVTALGSQTEALISNNIEGYNPDWDNRWFSEVQNYPDHWVIEVAIPYKTLRFEPGNTTWGLNFIRCDLKSNLYSVWSRVPINFEGYDLGYTGALRWDQAPEPPKGNVSIIPYAIGRTHIDYEGDRRMHGSGGGGLDAKVAITPSLNLDLTVNPDFSQVDVDQQVTNLQRFDLFFPERRTFFLENSDLFNSFGIPPVRPFFSRRIGLQDGRPVPILAGARLSGNLTRNLRIGLMSLQTAAAQGGPGNNYSVAAVQYSVLKRSNITAILLNRQGFDGAKPDGQDFGRNAGMEMNYISADGKWNAWGQFHASFTPERLDQNLYYCTGFMYAGRRFSHVTSYHNSQENFIVDMGFNARQYNYDAARDTAVRLGYQTLFQVYSYTFFPKSVPWLNQHGIEIESEPTFNADFTLNEWNLTPVYQFQFANQSGLGLGFRHSRVNLPFATDLIGAEPLPPGSYVFTAVRGGYESDPRKRLMFSIQGESGPFYNGKKHSLELALNFRVQPWGNFGARVEYNDVTLPDPYGTARLWLASPRIEINFSRNLFWTTFLQYNTQAGNFNINSRLQWRFRPMSDLFIVYTDNYGTEGLFVKNRALVVKLNYWLTI